jgi:hypothetical protein
MASVAAAATRALDRILGTQSALPEPSIQLQSSEGWARSLICLLRGVIRFSDPEIDLPDESPQWEGLPADRVPTRSRLMDEVGPRVDRPLPDLALQGLVRAGFDPGRYCRT